MLQRLPQARNLGSGERSGQDIDRVLWRLKKLVSPRQPVCRAQVEAHRRREIKLVKPGSFLNDQIYVGALIRIEIGRSIGHPKSATA